MDLNIILQLNDRGKPVDLTALLARAYMNFTSADTMKKHLKVNMPEMTGFHVANIYLLGSILSGETTGKILANLVTACWENKKAPVFVLENTILRESITEIFGQITSEYFNDKCDELGVYFANVEDRDTKERLVNSTNGAYRIWFISMV